MPARGGSQGRTSDLEVTSRPWSLAAAGQVSMSTAASGVEAAAAAVVDYGGAAAADGGALEGAQPDAKRQRLEEGQAAPPEFWRPEPGMPEALC